MKAIYGVRPDETVWISLGDPTGKTDPHYQFDLMEEEEAKLICDTFACVGRQVERIKGLEDALKQVLPLIRSIVNNTIRSEQNGANERICARYGKLADDAEEMLRELVQGVLAAKEPA